MIKIDRVTNLVAMLEQQRLQPAPVTRIEYVNPAHIRWIEFFTVEQLVEKVRYYHNLARLMMAPSGELIVLDNFALASGISKILVNPS